MINKVGRFEETGETSKRDSGLAMDCSPKFNSNVDVSDGENRDGTFVRKKRVKVLEQSIQTNLLCFWEKWRG